jgi:hypothetical protein
MIFEMEIADYIVDFRAGNARGRGFKLVGCLEKLCNCVVPDRVIERGMELKNGR